MNLAKNPHVKAELDNLERQFGNKALLNMDDYCDLFGLKRRKATCHVHAHGVPHIKIGERALYFQTQDLALYLAQKKAEQEGRLILAPVTKEDTKNLRGFNQMTHNKQLAGG